MEFVNRKIDRQKLAEILTKEHAENHIILLTGYTGVGKTGLIDYLFSNAIRSKKCLQVHVSKTSVGTIESGAYFSALYKQLTEYSQEKRTIITPFEFGIVNLKGFRDLIFSFLRNLAHLSENDKLFERPDENSVIRKRDYIINVLENGSFVIDFENMQNIDTQSIELLSDIMKKTKGNTYIFEYTMTEDSSSFQDFYSELPRFCATPQWYRLEKMDFEEAVKLLPEPLKDTHELAALENIYEKSHGNLMQIKLFDSKQVPKSTDIILDALDHLSKDEIYFVNVIYLNGGSISSNVLTRLMTGHEKENGKIFSFSQYKKLLDRLRGKGILETKDAFFQLPNSVVDRLAVQESGPGLYNAYALLKEYYMDMRLKQKEPELWVYQLFSLYVTFADSQISYILPDIRRVLLESKYPQAILEKLGQFKDKLIEKNLRNLNVLRGVCMLLTEVCIEIEDFESAQNNFEQIPTVNTDFSYDLLKAKLYALSSDQNTLSSFQSLEKQYPESSPQRLLIEICRLRFMLRTYSQAQSAKFAGELLENAAYRELPEYGFLLMNAAEVASSPKIAISMYEEADRIFSENQFLKAYAPLTKVNLSMSNGYIGKLQEARTNLQEADKSTLNRAAYILNNKAALDLLENTCTQQTISNLEDSLLLTSNYFEQLIIKNNLLIANLMRHQQEQAQNLCTEIETSSYESYNYGEFLQMNYQNLLFYYRTTGNLQQIQVYEQKIDRLAQSDATMEGTKRLAVLMKNGQKEDHVFYSAFPYRAEFLCYWGIPSRFYSLASVNRN